MWGDFKLDNFVLVPTAEREAEVDREILKNLKDKAKKCMCFSNSFLFMMLFIMKGDFSWNLTIICLTNSCRGD